MSAAPKFPDAVHALHGFRYQLLQSLGAWLNLRPNEELWLEVSEDFAVVSASSDEAVQVKASRAATRPARYSLQSQDVRAALSRFWARASNSPGARLTFLANGGVAVERDFAFPGGIGGLAYWGQAARGASIAPLRTALSALHQGEPLGHWLAGSPSDDEVREKLLRRVTWALEAADVNELKAQLREQVGGIYVERSLPVSALGAGLGALSDHIFDVACRSDPADRRLTVLDRHEAIEETIRALSLAKQMGAAERDAAADPHGVLVNELGSGPPALTQRNETVASIKSSVAAEPLVWLHGGHGAGKSTLARLLARNYGGHWLTLDLRPVQRDRGGTLAAWRELVRAIATDGVPDGVILDDFDDAAVAALSGRIAALTQQLAERGGRIIVTAPQPASAGRLSALGASAGSNIAAPYFDETEIKDLVNRAPAPEVAYTDAWALFIRIASGGGHPLLVASKVSSLRARGWPHSALAEDVGKTSEAIQVTREEARRALLRDLSALDQARSLDAGLLLRRIGAVFDRVDAGLVAVLAKLPPTIGTASDALAVLRGSWLELLPKGDLRISPVIADIGADTSLEDRQLWQRAAAEYWLGHRVLNERILPLCFWNAFWGQHDGVLMKLCETLQHQDREVLYGAAAFLAPMTALRKDTSLYPTNPILGVNLRLLQFQVADAVEDSIAGAAIAKRLLVELKEIEHEDIRIMMTSVSSSIVLMAQSVHVAPEDRLGFALLLRQGAPRVIELAGEGLRRSTEEIVRGFGADVDIASFLFASTISKVRNSDDFLEMVEALDALRPEDRGGFLNASAAIYSGPSVFVGSGWSRDQLEHRDMEHALDMYERSAGIIEGWMIPELDAELAVARSIILDEGLKDIDRALATIDAAAKRSGMSPALVRQKAKVLGGNGREIEAVDLILSIEATVGGASQLERGLALRDGGTWAARIGRFDIAARFFANAVIASDEVDSSDALSAGLRVDLALALWDSGERAAALITLADTFDLLASLDPAASRQAERVHQFARGAGVHFLSDTDSYPQTPRPTIAYGGASSLALSSEAVLNADLKPLSDNWRILALVEAECGLDAGIEARSRAVQIGPGLSSIELMIVCARYSYALTNADLDEALARGVHAVSGMRVVAAAVGAGNRGETRVEIDFAATVPIADIIADPPWRDALIRLAADVLVARRLQNRWEPDLLDCLSRAWSKVVGDVILIEEVLRAARGGYAITSSVSFEVGVASAAALDDDQLAADPARRFHRDLTFVGHLVQSLARRALDIRLVPVMQEGWSQVLKSQRFLLRSPGQHSPGMEHAISELPVGGLRAAARLIIATAPSVGETLTGNWAALLRMLATDNSK